MRPLRYVHLSPADQPLMHRTFIEAFADYAIDMSAVTEPQLRNRWAKNAVCYEVSVGAFDGERMVAFMAIGLDLWKGRPAAFDAATGVVRGYRGFGVAPAMFDLALEGLRERRVATFVLEVLQSNRPAVGTYRRAGFSITREFDCFRVVPAQGRLPELPPLAGMTVERIDAGLLPVFEPFADFLPSWETSLASIARIPDEVALYGARVGERWVGFAGWYPGLRWLLNPVVARDDRRQGVATRLLGRVLGDVTDRQSAVKLVNVDHRDTATLALLAKAGFELYASQYEMTRELQP